MRRELTVSAIVLGILAGSGIAQGAGPMSRYYAEDTDGIFWFMHVSDIHIDNDGTTVNSNFEFALGEGVSVIRPVFLFASGDLTNGSISGIPTSGQVQGEWDLYKQIYKKSGLTSSFYFDSPGNHDGYGDNGMKFYLGNSVQGQLTGSLYSETSYKTKFGEYYFANLNSEGTNNGVFNYGHPEFTNVDKFEAGLSKYKDAQLVFVFGHHHLIPRGDTGLQDSLGIGGEDNPPKNVAPVLKLMEDRGAFYMHGHVHQYKENMQGKVVANQIGGLGFVPSVDRSTADAYEKTKFRSNIGVGIVDHNAFVYRTTGTDDAWPFVAITAPVDQYLQGGGTPPGTTALGSKYPGDQILYGTEKNPYAYDICNNKVASPVRALVLAKDAITTVKLLIDGHETSSLVAAKDPLGIWTGSFDSTKIGLGFHELSVKASTAKDSRTDKVTIQVVGGPDCGGTSDGGVDADTGPVDSATDTPTDSSDSGKDSGDAQPDVAKDTGADGAKDGGLTQEEVDDSASDSGCACSVPSEGKRSSGSWAFLGVLGLALKLRNRKKRR